MFALFAIALLWLPVAAQGEKKETPPAQDPQRVAAVVKDLETAFAGTSAPDKLAAIRKAVEVPDPKVIAAIAKGINENEPQVKQAAIVALGGMRGDDALAALTSAYKRDEMKWKKDEALLPVLLKEIARHGDPSSIDILLKDPFSQKTYPAIQARILGLANIRSAKSVAGEFELMNLVGLRQLDPYMNDLRTALTRLTGTDQGPSPEMWQKWWSSNKDKVEIPRDPKPMGDLMQKFWDNYWATGGGAPAKESAPKPAPKNG
jgi:hypothetical protein